MEIIYLACKNTTEIPGFSPKLACLHGEKKEMDKIGGDRALSERDCSYVLPSHCPIGE